MKSLLNRKHLQRRGINHWRTLGAALAIALGFDFGIAFVIGERRERTLSTIDCGTAPAWTCFLDGSEMRVIATFIGVALTLLMFLAWWFLLQWPRPRIVIVAILGVVLIGLLFLLYLSAGQV